MNIIPANQPYMGVAANLLCQKDLTDDQDSYTCSKDLATKSFVIPCRGAVPEVVTDISGCTVPVIDIASNPTVTPQELELMIEECGSDEAATKHIIERGLSAVRRQIDMEVFKLIHAAVPSSHVISTLELTPDALVAAMAAVSEHDLPIGAIVMHTSAFWVCDEWNHPHWNTCLRAHADDGLRVSLHDQKWATFKYIPVYCCSTHPKNTISVLAQKEFVGCLPVRYVDKYCRAEDCLDQLGLKCGVHADRIGWAVAAKLGFSILNDYAVAQVRIGAQAPPPSRSHLP